jgi:hypothetical protein
MLNLFNLKRVWGDNANVLERNFTRLTFVQEGHDGSNLLIVVPRARILNLFILTVVDVDKKYAAFSIGVFPQERFSIGHKKSFNAMLFINS